MLRLFLIFLLLTLGSLVFAQTLEELTMSAEKGDAESQFKLALKYYNGEGTPKNLNQAFAWFQKSADQGVKEAQYNLGVRYDEGEGTPKNLNQAFAWYQKSAEQGYANAQFNLAVMYKNGEGTPKNYILAYKHAVIAKALGKEIDLQIYEKNLSPSGMMEAQQLAQDWWESYQKR